tara:strand:- start:495 stop:1544 length:1050 start_codon:yes stop_codon:yes gene_type:complete
MIDSGAIGALAASLLLTGAARGVDDCCTNVQSESNTRNEVLGNDLCASNWFSDTRLVGKFCLPLGSGYACGIQNTLTVGQEFELRAGFTLGGSAGGVSVEAATTYSVSQAFQHTAGACESCQLFASYSGAVLRQWDVSSFYPFGIKSQSKRTTFYTYGQAPTIMPCCEENTNCPGCRTGGNGRPGGGHGAGVGILLDPESPRDASCSGGMLGSFVVDLRVPEFIAPFGLPAWHPMNAPGTTLATLNGWQKRQIMRESCGVAAFEGTPLDTLVVIDPDGSAAFFDLVADPLGLVPCPSDMNCDGVLDLADINLFVNYFLIADIAVDFNDDGLIDLADITGFVSEFLAGCP